MSDEKLKWEKRNKLGYGDLVENLNKMANLIVKKELDDVMGKLDTLKNMGVIGEEEEFVIPRESRLRVAGIDKDVRLEGFRTRFTVVRLEMME